MPIVHVVCMKSLQTLPEQQFEALCRECEAKFDSIPGVSSASMGANWHANTEGFTHVIVMRFENREKLETFLSHPAHLEAGRLLEDVFSEFLVVDYETERP